MLTTYRTDVRYRTMAVTQYNTARYCKVSFVRPQGRLIATFRHIAGNKKVAQDVSLPKAFCGFQIVKRRVVKKGFWLFYLGYFLRVRDMYFSIC